MQSGHTGEGHGDDGDDGVEFRPPLPPEDRIWRHPSEVAKEGLGAPVEQATRGRRAPRILAVAGVSALIGATLSLGVVAAFGAFRPDTRVVERNVAVQPVTSEGGDPVAAIVARTGPAVAAIRVEREDTSVSGSAIVLRSDGHLLTNANLVDGADHISVRFHEGPAVPATLVGIDASTEVAVLRVDVADLEPAALGTATTVEVGSGAIALGALDTAGWSTEVTTGIISSVDRRMRSPEGHVLHGMMIVDVRLPPGTAGGPLLDHSGAVIGITGGAPHEESATPGDADEGYCVATPIDVASRIADQIIEHGRPRHVWLGIEGSDLPARVASTMGVAGGVTVSTVLAESPAAVAGLIAGDVIVGVGDEPVDSMSALIAILRIHDPDDEITVQVQRGDEVLSMHVVLAEKDAT